METPDMNTVELGGGEFGGWSKRELQGYLADRGVAFSQGMSKAELIHIIQTGLTYADVKHQILLELDTDTHSDAVLSKEKKKMLKDFTLPAQILSQLTTAEKNRYNEMRNRLILLFKKHDAAWVEYNNRAHLEPDNMRLVWRITITWNAVNNIGKRLDIFMNKMIDKYVNN